jgi:uracil phosphoribosyltransferase
LCSVTRSAESGGYDELENFPNKVEIFTASVEGNLSDPSYIMK